MPAESYIIRRIEDLFFSRLVSLKIRKLLRLPAKWGPDASSFFDEFRIVRNTRYAGRFFNTVLYNPSLTYAESLRQRHGAPGFPCTANLPEYMFLKLERLNIRFHSLS